MICSFGVRRVIGKHDKYMDFVSVHSELKVLLDRETDKVVRSKIEKIMSKVDKIIDIKREEYNESVKEFNSEFVKDVLDNPEFHKIRANLED